MEKKKLLLCIRHTFTHIHEIEEKQPDTYASMTVWLAYEGIFSHKIFNNRTNCIHEAYKTEF